MKKNLKIGLTIGISLIIVIGASGATYYFLNRDNPPPNGGDGGIDTNFDTLVWSEEFDYVGLPDPSKWNFELGDSGWGNNEEQNYVKRWENSRVENGSLTIEARKDDFDDKTYSSARITTQYKGMWTYGKIEARMILPSGRGTWGAFWMMPEESNYGVWPRSGEIDIMEYVGFNPTVVQGTTHTWSHYGGNGRGGARVITDCETAFHVYGAAWYPTQIVFYIDGDVYYTLEKDQDDTWEQWPFDQDFFIIFNLAIGGEWGGAQGIDDTIFPQQMVVDYVRVFQ